jgi:hypothetical protein
MKTENILGYESVSPGYKNGSKYDANPCRFGSATLTYEHIKSSVVNPDPDSMNQDP